MFTRITLAGLALLIVCMAGLATHVGAQVTPPQPAPITDYANYPANSGTALGCDASGVHGVEYSVNGGAPLFSLGDLPPIHAGDILEVSWTDVSDACNTPDEVQPIVLSMKSAPGPVFDATVDQFLELPYAIDFMGPMGGRITYVLPDLSDDSFAGCFGQIDFIVGLPLAVVGPNGSFYSIAFNGQKHMLIDKWNGAYDTCDVPPEVTTTTTEAPPVTTTTEAPTVTTAPQAAPAPAPVTVTAEANATAQATVVTVTPTTAPPAASEVVAARNARAEMPVTGCNWTLILLIGALACIGSAVAALLVGRYLARRTP
jgi:hypothetical protein